MKKKKKKKKPVVLPRPSNDRPMFRPPDVPESWVQVCSYTERAWLKTARAQFAPTFEQARRHTGTWVNPEVAAIVGQLVELRISRTDKTARAVVRRVSRGLPLSGRQQRYLRHLQAVATERFMQREPQNL